MKNKFVLALIFAINFTGVCLSQVFNIKNGSIDSTKLIEIWEIENKINEGNKKTLLEGDIFLFDNIRSSNYLENSLKYSFWPFDIENVVSDSIYLNNDSIIRFSFLYSDSNRLNPQFQVDGFVLNKISYINKKKYCFFKMNIENMNQLSNSSIQNTNKFIDTISKLYNFSFLDSSGSFMSLYKLRLKNYLPKSDYYVSYELNPKISSDFPDLIKTNKNALIADNMYVPLNSCNCDNVDLVLLIVQFEGPYKPELCMNNKDKIKYDNSHAVKYCLITLSDFIIIENGYFSFKNTEGYNFISNVNDKGKNKRKKSN